MTHRRLARVAGAVAVLVVACTFVLGQSQGLTEVTGSIVSLDEAFGSVGTSISAQDLQQAGIAVGDVVELSMSSRVIEIPVVSDLFPYLPPALPGLIVWGNVYIVGWYTNIAAEYGVTIGEEINIRLVEKRGYLNEIAEREVERVEQRDECSTDEEFANFREVTCGNIAAGVLFRSSHPADGSVKSAYAHALMVQAGVQTIINVGASWNDPQQAFDNSDYYRARGEEGAVLATNIGLAVTWPHFKTELGRVLRFMIDHEPPYLIHCSLGQDRAGIAVAVLGAIAGADLQQVVDDYALTFQNYYRIGPVHTLYPEVVEQLLSKLREMNDGVEVTPENLRGAVERYLISEVKLSETEIQLLQAKLSGVTGEEPEPETTVGGEEPAPVVIGTVTPETEMSAAISSSDFPELQAVVVLDDFEDGDLVSSNGASWQRTASEGLQDFDSVRVAADSFGQCLVLDTTEAAGLVSAHLPMGETDVSAYSGVYFILSSSATMDIGFKLDSWDEMWPSGMRDTYDYETVEPSDAPHLVVIPFSYFVVPLQRRGECPECAIRFDPVRFFNIAILTETPPGELRVYEVGFYKQLPRAETELPSASPTVPTTYRGVNVIFQTLTEADLDVLAFDWNVNLLRVGLGLSYWWSSVVPLDASEPCCREQDLLQLDWLIDRCEERGIHVLIDLHQFPGYLFTDSVFHDSSLWASPSLQDAVLSFWRTIASRYAHCGDVIYGYDLLCEPHDVDASTWIAFAQRIIDAIREVDSAHAVVVEPIDYGKPTGFSSLVPVDDENVIYSVHMYEPRDFACQGIHSQYAGFEYPSPEWDKQYLREVLEPVREFQLAYNARIQVGEYGVDTFAPPDSRNAYLRDIQDLFEEYGFNYMYWSFGEWGAYSLVHEAIVVPDWSTGVVASYVGDTEALHIFKEYLARNERSIVREAVLRQGVCLFDETHWDQNIVLNAPARDLAWRLSSVIGVQELSDGKLDTPSLRDVDLLVTGSPYGRDYDPLEVSAIQEYVRAGGALLMYAGSNPPPSQGQVDGLNRLLTPFGIQFADPPAVLCVDADWVGTFPSTFFTELVSATPECVDLGIGYYYLFCATSLRVSAPALPILVTGSDCWMDADWDHARDPAEGCCPCVEIAVAKYGNGRVAVLADQTFDQPCNWVALQKVVAWLLQRD